VAIIMIPLQGTSVGRAGSGESADVDSAVEADTVEKRLREKNHEPRKTPKKTWNRQFF
jgi:hypothetical protein